MHHHTAKNIPFLFLFFCCSDFPFSHDYYFILAYCWGMIHLFLEWKHHLISNYCRWTYLMLPCVQLNQCLFSIQHLKAAVLFYSLLFSIICPRAGNIHSSVTLLPFSFSLNVYYSILFEIFILSDRGSKTSKRQMRDPQLQPGRWLLTCGLDVLDYYLF